MSESDFDFTGWLFLVSYILIISIMAFPLLAVWF